MLSDECFIVGLFFFQSECLKEAFSELDMTSEVLQILMSPDKPYFRLSTFGNAGSTHVSESFNWLCHLIAVS